MVPNCFGLDSLCLRRFVTKLVLGPMLRLGCLGLIDL